MNRTADVGTRKSMVAGFSVRVCRRLFTRSMVTERLTKLASTDATDIPKTATYLPESISSLVAGMDRSVSSVPRSFSPAMVSSAG